MGKYYLAVDLGASSGRHMLGHMEDGRMLLEEVYRFENGMANRDGKLLWDTEHLFEEILEGMKRCGEIGRIPETMSVDTWAVDYVLLDRKERLLGDTYGYRDSRTGGMDSRVYQVIGERALYARTGIQKQIFNTIYQLMADKNQRPEVLERAGTFLMLPDYFQFLLTGNKVSEYTNATSTQLVDPLTKQWDRELMEMLGYPADIFLPLKMPGTVVGDLKKEIAERVGFQCKVVLCSSHDTASAVMAMPAAPEMDAVSETASPQAQQKEKGEGLYISSGTWSLMGVELESADCREESRRANFTNEGGYDYRFRYLKNIMGLWMIQSVRHELGDRYSFPELCRMAEAESDFPSRVKANDDCFLAPESMIREIQDYCRRTGQRVPESAGEIASVIYRSLAECYGETVGEIEQNTGRNYDNIYIIGGGSNASYLNQLTANTTGKTIYAGPGEATAIGNLMAQMIRAGELKDLQQARECVFRSFEITSFHSI